MKKAFRLSALLLVFCTLFAACSSPATVPASTTSSVAPSLTGKPTIVGNIPCSFPLATDGSSLNIMMSSSDKKDSEQVYVWQKYEQMTGVNINWTDVTKDQRKEAINTALANKSDIDLFMRCKVSASKLLQYGESGLILDLNKDGLLEKNAPNCWAYLQSHPDALASVTNPDGSIYALPQINSGAELRVSRKLFINKTWLENVNMEAPTTTEELYHLLKAFKEQDANGNGDSSDEIPFCPYDWASIQDALFGAFGLANRGAHNQSVDYDEETGKARFIASSDDYKAYVEYLNRLYTEGLLDKYVFTIELEQWKNNAANDKIGVFASTNLTSLPADKMDNWVALDEALEGPNGDKIWTAVRANFHSTGAAIIPTTCENPGLVLRWLDYFWTDEGTLFYHMGVENETFTANEDGTFNYSQAILDEIASGSASFDDVVGNYSPYVGGNNPTVEVAPYFMGGEMDDIPAEAARNLFKYKPAVFWPSFTFTTEENEQLGVYETDINKYVSTSLESFVTGKTPLSQWDSYVSHLNTLGKNEVLVVYQAAVDRYDAISQS